jgi:hypothetical protein
MVSTHRLGNPGGERGADNRSGSLEMTRTKKKGHRAIEDCRARASAGDILIKFKKYLGDPYMSAVGAVELPNEGWGQDELLN